MIVVINPKSGKNELPGYFCRKNPGEKICMMNTNKWFKVYLI